MEPSDELKHVAFRPQEIAIGEHVVTVATKKSHEVVGSNTTGARVWEAARVMCVYIQDNQDQFRDTHIMEVGCGTGVCGLVAARYATQVILTDSEPQILELARQSIALNQEKKAVHDELYLSSNSVFVKNLLWGDEKSLTEVARCYPAGFDWIIGSDVTYSFHTIPALVQTIDFLCAIRKNSLTPTRVFIADEDRSWLSDIGDEKFEGMTRAGYFCLCLQEKDFVVTVLPTPAKQTRPISLFQAQRKSAAKSTQPESVQAIQLIRT